MRIGKIQTILLVGLLCAGTGVAADDIDVLVAVTPAALAHGADPFALASQFENQMDIALDGTGSGLQNRDMNFYAYPIPTTYVGDAIEGSAAISAHDALSQGQDNALAVAREGLVPYLAPGFDLVVMVGWGFELQSGQFAGSLVCGWASDPVDYDNQMNRENQAWLILNIEDTCIDDLGSWLIPHEFGHMLGSNHQISGGVGDDTAPSYPVNYNHPVLETFAFTPVATPQNILGDFAFYKAQYSNPLLGYFAGSAIPAGSSVEDNAKLFIEDTWDMVADYRPIPQAPTPQADIQVCWCVYKQANQDVTFWSTDQTIPGQTFIVEQLSHTGSWLPVYTGDPSCYIFDVRPGGVWQRIKIIVEGMLPSEWLDIFLPGCDCLNGGSGGPGL